MLADADEANDFYDDIDSAGDVDRRMVDPGDDREAEVEDDVGRRFQTRFRAMSTVTGPRPRGKA